jgi:hypothetical protein
MTARLTTSFLVQNESVGEIFLCLASEVILSGLESGNLKTQP